MPAESPIVLLHGFGGSPQDWEPVLRGIPSLALPLPGHIPVAKVTGRSAWAHPQAGSPALWASAGTTTDEAPSGFAQAVDHLAKRLPPGQSDLVGYSLGGRLAIGLLAAYPERVRRILVIGAAFGFSDPTQRRDRQERDRKWADQLRQNPSAFFEWWDNLPLFQSPGPGNENHLEAFRSRRDRLDPSTLANTLVALSPGAMPSFDALVQSPNSDVSLCVGAHDETYKRVYESLQLPLYVVKKAGHRVLIDAPDNLREVILEWRRPKS